MKYERMLSDALIGWSLIAAMCGGFYFGVTRLVQFVANSVRDAMSVQRDERERIQEKLDDAFRDELFEVLEAEHSPVQQARP